MIMNFIEEKILKRGGTKNLKFRFPPEPNGSKSVIELEDGTTVTKYNSGLHLGHVKSMCLNFGLSEKYDSPCVLRFDDTNPASEESEYVNSMISDIEWLGFIPSDITYTSDYFSSIYEKLIHLAKKGLVYVDESSSEEISIGKGTPTSPGENSPYRNRSIELNLNLINRMKLGEFRPGSMTIRAKIDMSSPNMIMRDPIVYRILDTPHHRTGNDWKIYPMYDFAHPLCDYFEGISDSLCTLEFEVHRPLYMWVLHNCDLSGTLPEETEFARLNLDYSIMSKRKIKTLIDEYIVDGWDDPRLPTVSGLRRRGYTPESLKNFCNKVGVTKRDSLVSHLILEECLRSDLNKKARRFMGVVDPIKLTICNWPKGKTEIVHLDNNPEDPSMGTREVEFSGELWMESNDFKKEFNAKYHRLKIGGEVRLKGAYIVKAVDFIEEGGEIVEVICEYDPKTKSGSESTRKVKGTIHWVSRGHSISRRVNDYDLLFSHPNPDGNGKNFLEHVNNDSLVTRWGYFEKEIVKLKIGESVQLIRNGYYTLDKDGSSFNKSVALKEST